MRKKKWKLWTLFGVLGVLIIILGFVGWWAYGVQQELAHAQKPKEQSRFGGFKEKPEEKPPEWEGSERVNVLLLGADERGLREGEVARSDTMLVVSFDPASKTTHLFSVLRDTYVEIPGHRSNRVNTAITHGPNVAMKTIGNLTGLDIQYYGYVDFQGFINLVDAIGGVDYTVEKNMRWTDAADGHRFDIDLKKGYQHLDGEKALQYVRFRHDKMSDFTRTERQRAFLKAVADKMQSGWNLIRLPEILSKVTPHVETNMSTEDMRKLAWLAYQSHQAGSAQIPPMDLIYDQKVAGSSVLGIRDLNALRDYVAKKLAEDTTASSTSKVREDKQ
jgi:polyisoprenyl-teichoic acid--peptidoglycan teichoic acid transferase